MHGFNSSPDSLKAQLTKRYFERNCSDLQLLIPRLSVEPLRAIELIKELVDTVSVENLQGFIGSSLGGYYGLNSLARYIDNNPALKLVLINPALRPFELLSDYLGENTNYYTGETYQVLPSYMDDLKTLSVSDDCLHRIVAPESVLLLTQTGDEVLDYRQAVNELSAAKLWLQNGGDHAFMDYEAVLPLVRNFLLSA